MKKHVTTILPNRDGKHRLILHNQREYKIAYDFLCQNKLSVGLTIQKNTWKIIFLKSTPIEKINQLRKLLNKSFI